MRQNPILHAYSRFAEILFPKLWMPIALYLPLGIVISTISLAFHPRTISEILLLLIVGLFSWTLIEYGLHRFIFHWVTDKEPWRYLSSGFHMSHHEAVTKHEQDYVLTRPAGSLPFALIFYLFFSLVTLSFSTAALIETGIFIGYILYEGFHYAAHHFHPKNRVGKFLRSYHLQHHFQRPDRQFGVTSPFWDWVFKT